MLLFSFKKNIRETLVKGKVPMPGETGSVSRRFFCLLLKNLL